MKMRRSILCLCGTVAVLFLLVVWLARRPATTPPAEEDSPAGVAVQAPAVMPGGRKTVPASPSRSNVAPAMEGVNASVSTPALAKEEQTREVLSTLNDVPIDFFGKLLDQFGNPVVGAEITGSVIFDNGSSNGVRQVQTTSDGNGLFALHGGNGESLSVTPRKQGYALASDNA